MSDNRKILVAKRKDERNKLTETDTATTVKNNIKQDFNGLRKGIKRPVPITPKKNLANDRLKRLRTTLNEQVQTMFKEPQSSSRNTSNNTKSRVHTSPMHRKRPPSEDIQNIQVVSVTKVPKSSVCDSQNERTLKIEENKTSLTNPSSSNLERFNSEEMMEWSPTDEDCSGEPANNCVSSSLILANVDNKPEISSSVVNNAKHFYIVVDTNIFISQMQIIRNIIEMDTTGIKIPIVYIPWIVIEELDFIKEDSNKNSLKWKAQAAVKYIEKKFSEKNGRMIGQTLNDVNEEKNIGKGQDNKIISCCFQVLERYHNMILLTDDINLRNKAHINQIPVCSSKEILGKIKLSVIQSNRPKSQIILEKLTALCCTVIRNCAFKAYGEASYKMPIYQNVPQTIQDCIKIFIKYWFPVFQEVIMKQFKKSISDLSAFLTDNSNIKDDSEELNDLLRLCVRICIFLKDIDACKNDVEKTIREMNSVKGP